MSKTFQFGNGEWAVGKETALAYNSENNNFKPLPFTFDRASSATVVNKQGLIETVGTDEPRIDFLNNSKGHLLLEPERRNSVPYSNDFNQHSISGGSITSDNITSPDGGVNSDTFVEDTNNSQHRIREDISVSAGTYTMSVFVKGTDRFISLYPQSAGSAYAVFDIENATITKTGGSDYVDSKIENYGNGWYRCILTYTVNTGTSFLHIYLSNISTGNTAEAPTYTGNGSEMSFYGLQLEAGSYATSYIPTQGETNGVSRSAEIPFGREDMVDLNLYSSEMTWFYDINLFYREAGTTVAPRLINTSNNQVFIGINTPQSPNTDLRIRHKDGTTALNTSAVTFTNGGRFKIAVKITGTTGTAYINGTNVGTFTTLAASNYDKYENAQNNPNNINDMRFYDTALSDSELATLTTL